MILSSSPMKISNTSTTRRRSQGKGGWGIISMLLVLGSTAPRKVWSFSAVANPHTTAVTAENGVSQPPLAPTTTTTTTAPKQQRPTTTTTTRSGQLVQNLPVPGLKHGMDYTYIGDSDLLVSKVCLGTMNFGHQLSVAEGVELLTVASQEYGVNFFDTAEAYPVPMDPATQGNAERTIGAFLQQQPPSRRQDFVIATKVARAPAMTWLPRPSPDQTPALTRDQIWASVEASLERLQTDYIDLLQIHWPDRYVGTLFGSQDFSPLTADDNAQDDSAAAPISFEELLSVLQELIDSGKVRYVGVCNESAYGLSRLVHAAERYPSLYPKICSLQNHYSMVARKDIEVHLAECCYHYNVGLLPYSPLAAGALSGKYLDRSTSSAVVDRTHASHAARYERFPGLMDRYFEDATQEAVQAYADMMANNHHLFQDNDDSNTQNDRWSLTDVALSWCFHNPRVTSTIMGVTTLGQLHHNLGAYDKRLTKAMHEQIDRVYQKYMDPTKIRNVENPLTKIHHHRHLDKALTSAPPPSSQQDS